jgi:hypothetical protein
MAGGSRQPASFSNAAHVYGRLLCLPTPQAAKIEDIDTTLEEIQEMGENMKAVNEALAQVGGAG